MAAIPQKKEGTQPTTKKSGTDNVKGTYTPELVIALCGPIGSPMHDVADTLVSQLANFNYTCTRIRLSKYIEEHASKADSSIDTTSEHLRIRSLIAAGDALRKKYGHSVLAQLAIHKIRIGREKHKRELNPDTHSYPTRRVCHIIDSIKNQDELDLLRTVYGEMLFAIGVFSPMELREQTLAARGLRRNEIFNLVEEDSGVGSDEGQTVRKTFPHCDMFLRIEKRTDSHLEERVARFINLMLGVKVVTPTRNESAMYAAAMASANSACLSRQVGACITDSEGNVLSVGWNDVPSPHGGLYGDVPPDNDYRCWNHGGFCANDREKDTLAGEILKALGKVIAVGQEEAARKAIISSTRLGSLIEFSRAIHAEMHAIINAGQAAGSRLKGGKLFVTTYPCHSCARHIIAAGISEVYFIEPYRKSLALKLHSDAITEDENDTEKVRILAYDGVAPVRFLSLFRVPQDSRKANGRMVVVDKARVRPRTQKSMEALDALEALIAGSSDIEALVAPGGIHE
ncbi:anti-phage dCTP deaminase [Castellaniella hirudinis]|uniref:anti-phage dCTP deaminase n=1 Tax=Castellaniella hirudinis TaxID=1144617 RepID=UPI0039C4CE06